MASDKTATGKAKKETAGAFDIRFIIGALLGIYGIVVLLLGIFNNSDSELARGDGLNINLWTGIGLIIVSAFFLVWARVRPIIVPDDFEE